ncbi:MAG: c-type cytochrome, partial [Planctomycetaceae bacterium]
KVKKIHRANGKIFILLFLLIAYFCIQFLWKTKAETSPRATIHAELALAVILLLSVKISFVRVYRQFYGQVKILGLIIALLALGMIGNSAGHYLLITRFGTDLPVKRAAEGKPESLKVAVRTDPESIRKGKELYESKCSFCHDAYSDKAIVGPGHKGLLKKPTLPASQRPATAENVVEQLRNPYRYMPSFGYLAEEDVLNLIAFINTL